LDKLAQEWEENRSLAFAADLVGAAIVRGMPERAREAAEFIVDLGDAAPLSARRLARSALGLQTLDLAEDLPVSISSENLRSIAGRLKVRLREAPRNPVLWVELARSYTLIGQSEPAVRAMRTALALAPDNRFVLRSAARLFIHLKDPDRAYSLLRAAEGTRHDPWLLSAEIAIATASEHTPRFLREGERMLASAAAAPLHTSELASAIGTIELTGGRLRRARQLFRQALRMPTDNALAQVQWASANHIGLILTPVDLARPRSFEARSQVHRAAGEWESALEEAKKWLYDESFSRRAAAFASYLASVPLERYNEAAELARLGLAATPRDPLLLNNLAFALASSGRIDEAEEAFRQIPSLPSPVLRVAILATSGLLYYRRRELERGRLLYQQAIEEARREGGQFRVALACLYHAREALLAASPDANEVWRAAQVEAKKTSEPEVELLLRRITPSSQEERMTRD
jgi:tetratricopeptide (TPR) repeat protein